MAGRKPKIWSEGEKRIFEQLCGIMCTQQEICTVLKMDKRTLQKNIAQSYPDFPTWEEAFEVFSASGKMALRRQMFQLAQDGDRTMLIFLAKNWLGMSDYGPVDQSKKADEQAESEARKRATIVKLGGRYGKAAGQ